MFVLLDCIALPILLALAFMMLKCFDCDRGSSQELYVLNSGECKVYRTKSEVIKHCRNYQNIIGKSMQKLTRNCSRDSLHSFYCF